MTKYYDDPFALLGSHHLTLNQALRAAQLHDAVQQLRDLLAERGLQVFYQTRPWPAPADYYHGRRQPLSPTEDFRICRALYRFQIYSNLFFDRPAPLETDGSHKALFFGRHAPWVNSQLGFVYEYLERRVRVGELISGDWWLNLRIRVLVFADACGF